MFYTEWKIKVFKCAKSLLRSGFRQSVLYTRRICHPPSTRREVGRYANWISVKLLFISYHYYRSQSTSRLIEDLTKHQFPNSHIWDFSCFESTHSQSLAARIGRSLTFSRPHPFFKVLEVSSSGKGCGLCPCHQLCKYCTVSHLPWIVMFALVVCQLFQRYVVVTGSLKRLWTTAHDT